VSEVDVRYIRPVSLPPEAAFNADRLMGRLHVILASRGHGSGPLVELLHAVFSMSEEERRWYLASRGISVGGGVR